MNHAMSVPIHDEKRLYFNNPLELVSLMEKYPLDFGYIDWLKKVGYELIFCNDIEQGKANTLFGFQILIGSKGEDQDLEDLTLCHELVHTAVPDRRLSLHGFKHCGISEKEYEEYEKSLDLVAEDYAKNKQFVDYAKKTLTEE